MIMKHRQKTGLLIIVMILLVTVFGKNPVTADEAGHRTIDLQIANYDVVVAATDGTNYLYLRTGPSMDYPIICNIYDGTVLHIDYTSLDPGGEFRWGQTYYNNRYGWVSLKHVRDYNSVDTTPRTADYNVAVWATDGTDYLYLRTGPSMDYQIICNIYNGEKLHITSEATDPGGGFTWGQTVFNGQSGWVSLKHVMDWNQYLAAHPEAAPTPEPTKAPTQEPTTSPEPVVTETPEPTATAPVVTKQATPTPVHTQQTADNKPEEDRFRDKMFVLIVVGIAVVAAAIIMLILIWARRMNRNVDNHNAFNSEPSNKKNYCYCEFCGARIPSDSPFCPNCGNKLDNM